MRLKIHHLLLLWAVLAVVLTGQTYLEWKFSEVFTWVVDVWTDTEQIHLATLNQA